MNMLITAVGAIAAAAARVDEHVDRMYFLS